MKRIAKSLGLVMVWPALAGAVAAIAGCTANVGDSETGSDNPAAGATAETSSQALLATPSKADIDAYAKAHGFPKSDYPYYEAANGCGNDWYVSIVPQSLPQVDMSLPCVPGKPLGAIPLNGACNNHDHCYVTAGSSKATCDTNLYNDIVNACTSNLNASPMTPCPPFVPPPPPFDPVTTAVLLAKTPFMRHNLSDLERCKFVASMYYNAVKDFGSQYFGPSQQKAADYKALVDTFINTKRYGVCTGDISCTRAPKTLHRMTVNCNGTLKSDEQVVALGTSPSNVKCVNRYQAQCIDDGTFDSYYMEWCDYATPRCNSIASKVYACDPGAPPPSTTCKATKLHRTQYSCSGTAQSKEQVVDLVATGYWNYTCTNRFKEQCVSDGTWDSYYSEWCEYTCP